MDPETAYDVARQGHEKREELFRRTIANHQDLGGEELNALIADLERIPQQSEITVEGIKEN